MTDKLREAAQQAEREAFEAWVAKVQPAYWRAEAWQTEAWAMWQSISAALAQQDAQTEQEPVAYMLPRDGGDCAVFREPSSFATRYSPKGWIPLYTAPQPAAPTGLQAEYERGLEDAAKVCDEYSGNWYAYRKGAEQCAASIRALKGKK